MEKGTNREIYLNYFIDQLFQSIQANPCPEPVTYMLVRERAEVATDIYFTALAANKNPTDALEAAQCTLRSDYRL